MPYCDDDAKEHVNEGYVPCNVGELTYEIQQCVQRYLLRASLGGRENLRYQHLAEARAAVVGALLDFEERVVKPYEMCKAAENGDVWDSRLIATNR